jgi:hypothetical protein
LASCAAGAAESTATREAWGPAAGGGHAGVADEGALADLDPLGAQPAAAELVAADEGVVGEEGVVVDLGELGDQSTVEASTSGADPGAERTQPQRGDPLE